MPRDSNGNYTLPSGNPVVTGTVIAAGWANPTMGDIGNELTNSLDRQGRGGMLAPFKFLDGTAGSPGMTWTTEPTMGFFRAGASDMEASVAGVPRMRWTGVGVDVWDSANNNWLPLTTAAGSNFALLNAANVFNSNQTLQNTAGDMAWVIKNKPFTKGALFGFSVNTTDAMELALYNGTTWAPKITAAPTTSYYDNDTHYWRSGGVATIRGQIDSNGNVQFGNSIYAAVSAGARFLGAAFTGTAPVVNGVWANDGVASPRAELFAQGDGVSAGTVGLDWVFSTGVQEFQFRRAGLVIFSYDQSALRLRSTPNRAQTISWQADDNGSCFWNTSAGTSSFQWYLSSSIKATLSATDFTLAAGVDMRINTESALRQNTAPMFGLQARDVEGWKGPVLYHGADSANYKSGNVITSTTEAPASGYTGGTIWIQREA